MSLKEEIIVLINKPYGKPTDVYLKLAEAIDELKEDGREINLHKLKLSLPREPDLSAIEEYWKSKTSGSVEVEFSRATFAIEKCLKANGKL